jgi:hypothetical protein
MAVQFEIYVHLAGTTQTVATIKIVEYKPSVNTDSYSKNLLAFMEP